jgi:serine/threonine-protein kinase
LRVITNESGIQERLAEALREWYAVEREIAQGGMATVYLARDLRQGRDVAIKVMHPRLSAALGPERFRREIVVARGMDHPLVVPLLDSGMAAGMLYYAMPYVEGESLHQRLERERQLPLADALGLARDVAEALEYAHGRDILHRDVKPENILLSGGRALVVDFGLARAISTEYTRLTRTGMLVGTIYYMSPEQLREDSDIDQRADVYSLGCILYEMLTGEPPFAAPSLKELVARILSAPIPSARRLTASIPPAVDAVIARALAKNAAERFRDMREFAAALPPATPL